MNLIVNGSRKSQRRPGKWVGENGGKETPKERGSNEHNSDVRILVWEVERRL